MKNPIRYHSTIQNLREATDMVDLSRVIVLNPGTGGFPQMYRYHADSIKPATGYQVIEPMTGVGRWEFELVIYSSVDELLEYSGSLINWRDLKTN